MQTTYTSRQNQQSAVDLKQLKFIYVIHWKGFNNI